MGSIIPITGNVKFKITLDPGVWIFDDRKLDLDTYFTENHVEIDEMEEYKRVTGKHWSREIMEGSTFPPTLKTEKKYEKTKMLTGTFGILLEHFLKNAEPSEDATTITLVTTNGDNHTYPLEQAKFFIFKFSQVGKPLRDDGPIHVLFKDGSNIENPLRNIEGIRID